MPPAESRDQVPPLSSVSTEQRCDVVIYTQASANTHSCCLAGCKTTGWLCSSWSFWLLLIRCFCSCLSVISLKLKAPRRPQRHSKALNDIARQVGSNRKNLRQSLHISRLILMIFRVLYGINPCWNVSLKAFLQLQALKMLSFPIFYPPKLSPLLKVLLFHVVHRGYAGRVETESFQMSMLLSSF